MKIVNRETFLTLPANTVYSLYQPQRFDGICIKDVNCGDNDWFMTDICPPPIDSNGSAENELILDEALKGTTFKLDFNLASRDGMFEPNQLFAIWDKQDVQQLIIRLQECL